MIQSLADCILNNRIKCYISTIDADSPVQEHPSKVRPLFKQDFT